MVSPKILQAASHGAVLVRAPQLGTIAARGSDRQTWLNGLATSDLAKLAPGLASYGLFLVKVGRILSDAWVVPAGDRLLLGVPRDRVGLLREHFERYLMMEDASHEDTSDELTWAFVHGPRASELVREVPPRHGAFGGEVDVTGWGGGVVVSPRANLEALLEDMVERQPNVEIASEQEWEALRVRRFLPRFGVDFGDKNYPQEAALEKLAVSFNKGCYLGQEVVCRLEMRGHVIKKIVPVRLASSDAPPPGAEVKSLEGKVLGSISSATPDEGGALALAMLRHDFTEPGTKLDIGGREATVLGR